MRVLAAATLLLACSPGDGLASSFSAANDPPTHTPDGSSGSSSSSSDTGSSSTSSSASSSETTTGTSTSSTADTTEPQPDFGPPGPLGCQGKHLREDRDQILPLLNHPGHIPARLLRADVQVHRHEHPA